MEHCRRVPVRFVLLESQTSLCHVKELFLGASDTVYRLQNLTLQAKHVVALLEAVAVFLTAALLARREASYRPSRGGDVAGSPRPS